MLACTLCTFHRMKLKMQPEPLRRQRHLTYVLIGFRRRKSLLTSSPYISWKSGVVNCQLNDESVTYINSTGDFVIDLNTAKFL